ncbi:acyl-coenzyme A thioesterase 13-like [Lytechinus pictus]|uniref:acyl-coenzyme A thioesterase 13-like n=1 Tax=Lytechinus pictus TaxID=7653 RepID=UPI0030BA11AE
MSLNGATKRAADILKYCARSKGFDNIFSTFNVIAASPNKVTAEYIVKDEHCNQYGTLHGGFTATAVDFMTTIALIADEEDSRPGVSLNLSVNYMKALKIGDKITLEGEVLRKGRSVAYTTARIFKENGELAAHGTHIKHLGN